MMKHILIGGGIAALGFYIAYKRKQEGEESVIVEKAIPEGK